MKWKFRIVHLLWCFFCFVKLYAQQQLSTAVLVIGGGTGGTAAAIQSARSGVKTILVEPTNMLGGMLTAAGVSCTDGNDALASGIWQSFREALHAHYGTNILAIGWVSETCFEPHVGDSIFKAWASGEKNLTVMYGWRFDRVLKQGNTMTGAIFKRAQSGTMIITSSITIDATELGDVLAGAGAGFDVGTEDPGYSKEKMAPGKTDIIQDLTWAAVLQDFGDGKDMTIPRPENYDPKSYYCCCTSAPCTSTPYKVDSKGMLDYGKLPGGKFMLNWPAHGNDSYLNVIADRYARREQQYASAKQHTLGFIYFIQTELGFRNLGLARDELEGGLALIPYNREGRRVKGVVRMNVNHILEPFNQDEKLYRTAIAVGDYPVDHHHGQNPLTPAIHFPPIPSFSIPLGALIPAKIDGLIVCEKGISVSNIVNGASRLQPVVLLTGQAAGILAAWSVRNHKQPRRVKSRSVQQALLNAKCYLMPYADVAPDDPHWESIQRVGVTGIMKGAGKPEGWANKTFFYPDSSVGREFIKDMQAFDPATIWALADSVISIDDACLIVSGHMESPAKGMAPQLEEDDEAKCKRIWYSLGLTDFDPARPIRRWELAVLLDKYYNAFNKKNPDLRGHWKK